MAAVPALMMLAKSHLEAHRALEARAEAEKHRHEEVMARLRSATPEDFDRIARAYRAELAGGPRANLD